MINCISNGVDQKHLFAKHVSNPSGQTQGLNHKRKKHILPQNQKQRLNDSKHKESSNHSNFTQRALFSKHNFINDLTKHSESLTSPLSPKSDKKYTKANRQQTPTKKLRTVISLTILYNSRLFHLNADKADDGLSLALKLNNSLSLKLNDLEIEAVALDLANQMNNIIDTIQQTNQNNISNHNKNNGIVNRNINGFVIDLNELLIRSSKIKIMIKYGKMIFNYYINKSRDEINDVIEDIFFAINNPTHKYDKITLKEKLINSINEAIENSFKQK